MDVSIKDMETYVRNILIERKFVSYLEKVAMHNYCINVEQKKIYKYCMRNPPKNNWFKENCSKLSCAKKQSKRICGKNIPLNVYLSL